MKTILFIFADIDNYIGIIIGIIILVISGIGSARKRKAQQSQVPQAAPESDETESYDTEPIETGPVGNPQSPLERLELLLSGQQPFGSFDEPQYVEDEEVPVEESIEESNEKPELPQEGLSSLEKHDVKFNSPIFMEGTGQPPVSDKMLTVEELFADMDEIKKAVIYSEIFTRKYT